MDMTGAKGGVSDVAQEKIDAPLHHNLLPAGFHAASYCTTVLVCTMYLRST